MAKDKFKITSIDQTTGNMTVEFTFKDGVKTQTLAGLPIDDDKALKQALNDYGQAYRAGLKAEKEAKKTVDPKVTALVNKSEDINDEVDAQQVTR